MRPFAPKPGVAGARRVIVLDADARSRGQTLDLLHRLNLPATACGVVGPALAEASAGGDVILLASAREPTDRSIGLIEAFAARRPETPIVAYAEDSDARAFRRLHRLRVADVLPWPLEAWEARAAVAAAGSGPTGGRRPMGHVLSVIGAKGGVGKTTIATNLGVMMASGSARSVLLIDLDTRFGDCAVQLDLAPQFTLSDLAGLADGDLSLGELERALTWHVSGLRVLAGPQHPRGWQPVSTDQIAAMLTVARRRFDYIVIDTPGAFTELLQAGIDRSETVLIVSSCERTSLRDTAQLLQLLEAESLDMGRVRVVLDAVHHVDEMRIGEAARILGQPPHIVIPYDERVVHATSAGLAVVQAYPSTPASRELRRLAASVAPELAERPGSGFRRAFLRRLRAPAAPLRRSA